MAQQESDAIVWGASCGVLLLVTVLSYITYRRLKPKEEPAPRRIVQSKASQQWVENLRNQKSVVRGIMDAFISPLKNVPVAAEEVSIED
mmetsp:Transcript_15424/g.23265  ORF Transcript_15424/g.23265 Transcript_15424/m.23265 type:complete len:89 (+) Transcript_15424:56-322(+)